MNSNEIFADPIAYWKQGYGLGRDQVFLDVIKRFNGAPVHILEIGAARDNRAFSRFSDGWSSVFWCDYIAQHGGSLTIIDISKDALDKATYLVGSFMDRVKLRLIEGDGEVLLAQNNDFDLIYLDGSDDPAAMLRQFSLCNLERSAVVCDDFHVKGTALRQEKPDFFWYPWPNNGHQMAAYGKGFSKGVKEVSE